MEPRQLEYIGVDFWSRPMFQDAKGNIFGNMDILFNGNATYEEVTERITEDDIYYFGREVDGDPDGTKIDATKIKLVKKLNIESNE
jgi:hypothetical protein